jgi:hypothetical protein
MSLFDDIRFLVKDQKDQKQTQNSLQLTVEDVGETGSLFGWRVKIRQMYKILTKSTD